MEEILSSIKRIIAEEGDAPVRGRGPVRKADRAGDVSASREAERPADEKRDDAEVLELSDPIPPARQIDVAPTRPDSEPEFEHADRAEPVSAQAEPIVSARAAEASRGALEALSRLMIRAEPPSDGTLEGLVREMLRPMLREWMDAHLPSMVETMVAAEIARISGQSR